MMRLLLILSALAVAACSSPTAPVAHKPNDTNPWIVANHPTVNPEGK